jgi:hypothetical protein
MASGYSPFFACNQNLRQNPTTLMEGPWQGRAKGQPIEISIYDGVQAAGFTALKLSMHSIDTITFQNS